MRLRPVLRRKNVSPVLAKIPGDMIILVVLWIMLQPLCILLYLDCGFCFPQSGRLVYLRFRRSFLGSSSGYFVDLNILLRVKSFSYFLFQAVEPGEKTGH